MSNYTSTTIQDYVQGISHENVLDVCMCVGHLLVPRDLERWQEGATDLSVPLCSKSWVLVCMHNLSSDFILLISKGSRDRALPGMLFCLLFIDSLIPGHHPVLIT